MAKKSRKKKVTKGEIILAIILLVGVTAYRWYQASQMESYSMFLSWKSQYCKNDYTTK